MKGTNFNRVKHMKVHC